MRQTPKQRLTKRLAVHAQQTENIASGRTSNIPVGEVGARFLADDLRGAIAALSEERPST